MTKTIYINNTEFVLHCSGSIYWPERSMLLIADVHLGKITHFRKAGFPIPPDSIRRNFKLLNSLLDIFRPEKVCFLGDLFHSDINAEWDLFSQWVCEADTEVILIMGNHDIHTQSKFCDVNITIYPEMEVGKFLLTHKPVRHDTLFNFAGHIHPCIMLRGKGRQSLKLRCFFRKPYQMILPAFGEFTGAYEMTREDGDIVYAVIKDDVIEVG